MKNLKQTTMKIWSCIQKSDFPLDVNHLSEFLVYNAVVNTSATKNYYGTCKKKSFIERYSNHTSSFQTKPRQKSAEFSN